MAKFRKKPVVIEAVRWTGDVTPELQELFNGEDICIKTSSPPYLSLTTLEGSGVLASVGDWVIRGVKGELYPCKPDIFEATYEPADAPTIIIENIDASRAGARIEVK